MRGYGTLWDERDVNTVHSQSVWNTEKCQVKHTVTWGTASGVYLQGWVHILSLLLLLVAVFFFLLYLQLSLIEKCQMKNINSHGAGVRTFGSYITKLWRAKSAEKSWRFIASLGTASLGQGGPELCKVTGEIDHIYTTVWATRLSLGKK